MRLEWAKGRYGTAKKTCVKTEAWEEIDESFGEYMSPIEVVNRMGGWKHKESVRRGLNVVASCCQLGGNIMQCSWQAKARDVRLLKQIHREMYSKKWAVRV